MLFKNLETGLTWEVTNPDKIKELQTNEKYMLITDEKPKKTTSKKKETTQE